jgi:hypothetical protein
LANTQEFSCSNEGCTETVIWEGTVQSVVAAMRNSRKGSFSVYLQCEQGHVGKYVVETQ